MIVLHGCKEDIEEYLDGLKLVDRGLETALVRTLNKSIVSVRAEASKMIRKDYNVKVKDIKEDLRLKKAHKNRLYASFGGEGSPGILLYRFGVRVKPPSTKRTRGGGYSPKVGIKVLVRKDKGRIPVKGGFVAKMPSGHIGVFKRKSGSLGNWWQMQDSDKIEELYGPSALKILASDRYEIPLEDYADEVMEKNLRYQAEYLLQKAGLR